MLRQRHLLLAVLVPVLMLSGVVGVALAISAGWAQFARPTLAMFRGTDPVAPSKTEAAVVKIAATPSAPVPAAPAPPKLGLDIARIDPDGTSVIAGIAKPNAQVTVYADGVAVGTVTSDGNGEWVLITSHKFATPTPRITLNYGTPRVDVAALENSTNLPAQQVAPQPAVAKPAIEPRPPVRTAKTVRDVTDDMLRRLETLTEKARKEAPGRVATTETPTALSAGPSDSASAPAEVVASADEVVPVPIKFVYRSAKFTKPGRKAADLLLTYLLEKSPKRVVLTGHADERGSAPANMRLSKRRLDAIAAFLRKGGFTGDLVLLPKGEAEEFAGVDRSRFSRRQLWELDRRVEVQTIQ